MQCYYLLFGIKCIILDKKFPNILEGFPFDCLIRVQLNDLLLFGSLAPGVISMHPENLIQLGHDEMKGHSRTEIVWMGQNRVGNGAPGWTCWI